MHSANTPQIAQSASILTDSANTGPHHTPGLVRFDDIIAVEHDHVFGKGDTTDTEADTTADYLELASDDEDIVKLPPHRHPEISKHADNQGSHFEPNQSAELDNDNVGFTPLLFSMQQPGHQHLKRSASEASIPQREDNKPKRGDTPYPKFLGPGEQHYVEISPSSDDEAGDDETHTSSGDDEGDGYQLAPQKQGFEPRTQIKFNHTTWANTNTTYNAEHTRAIHSLLNATGYNERLVREDQDSNTDEESNLSVHDARISYLDEDSDSNPPSPEYTSPDDSGASSSEEDYQLQGYDQDDIIEMRNDSQHWDTQQLPP